LDGPLAWTERLALAAWAAAGHPVTLFGTTPPGLLPAGVAWADAAPLAPRATPADRPAVARLALLARGFVSAEPDVIALAPLPDGPILARARAGEDPLGTAVLRLPPAMLEAARAAAELCGAAADLAALLARVLPADAAVMPAHRLAALAFADRQKLFRAPRAVATLIAPDALTLRLWPATRREIAARHGGVAPEGSYLAALAARFGIDPAAHPVPADAAPPPPEADAAALMALMGDRVAVLADVGGTSPALAAAAFARFDCDVLAIDLDRDGGFPAAPSAWVEPYKAALAAAGVPERRLRVVSGAGGLKPADVILNLGMFGDTAEVKHLAPVLDACLHADTVMLTDIRKGSGSYPFLKARGTLEPVSVAGDVTRALFRPHPPQPEADPEWAAIARGLAGPEGFYTEGAGHSFLYVPRGDTLVVTFDNLDIAMTRREDRRPWGYQFIEKQGWSMLGVMAGGWTWYREPWVWAEFDRLRDTGFFRRFARVVFYGASMGGYAACAFVPACPGADVVAISPQSTLDRTLVPWETRYRTAWGRDFTGPYGDAAAVSAAARRVTLIYDPYEPLDAAHVARFGGANVVKLRAPLMGHRLGSSLHQMGILNPIILAALDGSLTPGDFYAALRARRTFPRYQRELFERAAARHPKLARRLAEWVLARGDHRAIREGLRRL
jgi:hypothetical protein